MNDIFDKRLARPMLIANQSEPFNSSEYLFELKFDGIRCLAYIDRKSVDLRNKRNKELINQFPELSNIFSNVNAFLMERSLSLKTVTLTFTKFKSVQL